MADNRGPQAAPAADRRIRDELRATLAAYHELGPAYEQQVIDSFLDRIRPVLHPSPASSSPRPPLRYRRRGSGRGLLIGLAILIGWLMFAGPLSGHGHHARYDPAGLSGSPFTLPGIIASAPPVAPQLSSSSSVQ